MENLPEVSKPPGGYLAERQNLSFLQENWGFRSYENPCVW